METAATLSAYWDTFYFLAHAPHTARGYKYLAGAYITIDAAGATALYFSLAASLGPTFDWTPYA